MPNRVSDVLATRLSALESESEEDACAGAVTGAGRRHRRGNRRRDRIDVRLERVGAEAVRVVLRGVLRHVRDHVAPGVHDIELTLKHGDARLQVRLAALGSARLAAGRELAFRRIDLGLDRGALGVQLLLHAAEGLRRRRVFARLRGAGLAAQQLRIGARDLERRAPSPSRQSDDWHTG